jgi:hypothetical protein
VVKISGHKFITNSIKIFRDEQFVASFDQLVVGIPGNEVKPGKTEQIVPSFELFMVGKNIKSRLLCTTINQNKTDMKKLFVIIGGLAAVAMACDKPNREETNEAVAEETKPAKHLFMDVHNLEPGKVTFDAVAGAHQKDLATQGKYDVSFIKYWVDEEQGKVYCLAEARDSASIYNAHKEAHGLVPAMVSMVSDGPEAKIADPSSLYLDIHYLGAGKVTAADVAAAHEKDLAEQGKHGVNFINYWVNEPLGTVMCLSEAKDANSIIETHKLAHGLLPDKVEKVQQGQ